MPNVALKLAFLLKQICNGFVAQQVMPNVALKLDEINRQEIVTSDVAQQVMPNVALKQLTDVERRRFPVGRTTGNA